MRGGGKSTETSELVTLPRRVTLRSSYRLKIASRWGEGDSTGSRVVGKDESLSIESDGMMQKETSRWEKPHGSKEVIADKPR
jgi:hypothetical protein